MPEKLYKIGEVMKYSDLSRQTIHNYTMIGLIFPRDRTDSGHRLYGEEVFERLKKINRYKRHHTLREVKVLLEKQDREGTEAPQENGDRVEGGG
ncbi:MAG: helix-turn-helix domain-containing protein [Planctomycetota bacterium]|jgi:DNA-binding transcriptional MerR regulator